MIDFDKIRSIRSTFSPAYEKVEYLLKESLYLYPTISDIEKIKALDAILSLVKEDIRALAERDPAAKISEDMNLCEDYVAETYSSLYAVICYRVAHYLQFGFKSRLKEPGIRDYLIKQARKITEECKGKTKIDIHPAAKIGKRFVLDHGFGTIIGETSKIGKNCCFLQGVILGSRQINADNNDFKITPEHKKKRHPTIEDNVTIAGNVRVWGNITIGHDSTIQAYSIVTENVPPYSIIQVTNQLQVVRFDNEKFKKRKKRKKRTGKVEDVENYIENPIKIYGVVPGEKGVKIFGCNLDKCTNIKLIDNNKLIESDSDCFVDNVTINYDVQSDVINLEISTLVNITGCSLYLCAEEYSCIIKDALAWKEYLKTKNNI